MARHRRESDDIEFLRMMIRFGYEFVYRREPPPNFYLYNPERGAGPILAWRDVRYAARLEDKGYLETSADSIENRERGGGLLAGSDGEGPEKVQGTRREKMAAYFLDLDGTVLKHGTNEPLPGIFDIIAGLRRAGHQIIYATYRGHADLKDTDWNKPPLDRVSTQRALEKLGLLRAGDMIFFGVVSPRIIVNDGEAYAVVVPSDQGDWKPLLPRPIGVL